MRASGFSRLQFFYRSTLALIGDGGNHREFLAGAANSIGHRRLADRRITAAAYIGIVAEYEKMASAKVTKAKQAAFKAAAQKVWDSRKLKPFCAFVKKLRAAAN